MKATEDLISIKEASEWATRFTDKTVTTANISYLIQYARINKINENSTTKVSKQELKKYYNSFSANKEVLWKTKLGQDLNWHLSFDQYKESETTKHVHRLHPYKGKFIPQLVEYFLDDNTDDYKNEVYFKKGDIVLDPFSGSGTTLVQANELGMNAIGIDISTFNSFIGNCKLTKYNFDDIQIELEKITKALNKFLINSNIVDFENNLLKELYKFNNQFFPSPEFKHKLHRGDIIEIKYGSEKEKMFYQIYFRLVNNYKIKLNQDKSISFLDKWYSQHIREEIELVFNQIKKIKNLETKNIISLILSRTIRSCRATTHADLATLVEPITQTYYCSKHGKICKPLFSILKWWQTYSKDTLKRLNQFDKLRTNTFQFCLTGDSRNINIFDELKNSNPELAKLIINQKINGIFSSPPYVGLINYHEQHAYAYDLFGFKRSDDLEIGPLFKGQGKEAKESYIKGISSVLINCKKFLVPDFNIFLVANDKYNIYPIIAENAGLRIQNKFKRPVLNRTEKDKGVFSELIFHLKNK